MWDWIQLLDSWPVSSHLRVIFPHRYFPIHYRDNQQYLSVYWQNSFPNLWVKSQFPQLWLQTRISTCKSSDDNYDNLGLIIILPMSTWILDGKKNPVFFSRDKRGITAPGGRGNLQVTRQRLACFLIFLSHTHSILPLSFFPPEKPPKKRLIMKGKLNFTL